MVQNIDRSLIMKIGVGSNDIAAIQRVLEIGNARASIIWHVFNVHRNLGGRRVVPFEIFNQTQICAERWIVTKVSVQLRPIIGVNKMLIALMDNIHIPPH
jgi:hypothetical protein